MWFRNYLLMFVFHVAYLHRIIKVCILLYLLTSPGFDIKAPAKLLFFHINDVV